MDKQVFGGARFPSPKKYHVPGQPGGDPVGEKGSESAGKRMRHLDVRYFFIKDCAAKGEMIVEYCNTKNMVADFLTKPLQGKAFLDFRAGILGQ